MCDASELTWHVAFLEHTALQRKRRLRARALLALALISEPMERQWKEIFLDVAWTAWSQVVRDAGRLRSLPKAQQMYEKVLQEAHTAMGLNCLTVWHTGAVLPLRFSDAALCALLQKALPSVRLEDLACLVSSLPKVEGQTSFFALMSWLYPETQSIDTDDWKVRRARRDSWARRSRSLLVLSHIAEPSQHFWREVFLDLAWSAWAGAFWETRRRRSLPSEQRDFEVEADRLAALSELSPEDVASTALHNVRARRHSLPSPTGST